MELLSGFYYGVAVWDLYQFHKWEARVLLQGLKGFVRLRGVIARSSDGFYKGLYCLGLEYECYTGLQGFDEGF